MKGAAPFAARHLCLSVWCDAVLGRDYLHRHDEACRSLRPILSDGRWGRQPRLPSHLCPAPTTARGVGVECLRRNVSRQPVSVVFRVDANVGRMPGCLGTSRVLLAPEKKGDPTDPLAAHRDAVSSKEADVITQARNVYENQLIIACLKRSIALGRALDKNEYDLILGTVSDPNIDTAFIRQFTTISPFDMKEAEAKLEKAKIELKEAEAELEEAEAELEKAEAKLEKAKIELEKAEAELEKVSDFGQESNIDNVLAQRSALALNPLAGNAARDIEGFTEFLLELALDVCKSQKIEMQDTKSLVLMSASGVGKTFMTLAFTWALRSKLESEGYFPIALYLGLNSKCPLTDQEVRRMKRDTLSSDGLGLEQVLMRRLLLQLSHLASLDVIGADVLWDKDTELQKMPTPKIQIGGNTDWGSLHLPSNTPAQEMKKKMYELLDAISAKVGKAVFLFPIVDEAQLLDAMYVKDDNGAPQGARLALRMLRSLQAFHLLEPLRHRVLGIVTGINPNVFTGGTLGTNVRYKQPLHPMDGFGAITEQLLTASSKSYTPSQIGRIATVFYPVVREVEHYATKKLLLSLPKLSEIRDTDVIVKLLIASGIRKPICSSSDMPWDSRFPATFIDDSEYTPLLGIGQVATVGEQLGLGSIELSRDDILKFVTVADSSAFETASEFCLSVLLALCNYVGGHRPYLMSSSSTISKEVLEWLTVGKRVQFKDGVFKPEDPKKAYFPSSTCLSHEVAFNVDVPLHASLESKRGPLRNLQDPGDTVFMTCGGSAPVDFIIITLLSKGTHRDQIQIRLCDAKQVTSKGNSVQGMKMMPARFNLVKKYLNHHLQVRGKYDIDFKTPAVLTTATNYRKGTGIVVLSPKTCQFPPVTDWWFAMAPSVLNPTQSKAK